MISLTTARSSIEVLEASAVFPFSAAELEALSQHMRHCNSSRGRWFLARCLAESFDDFAGNRFVTTLAIASLMIVAAVMAL